MKGMADVSSVDTESLIIEPPVPANEVLRLAALRSIGVLDTPADPGIDSLTRHLARIWSAPIAAVSLIDDQRQWFKSSVGLDMKETPRSISFCAHVLTHRREPLVVEDARVDRRFTNNPLVTGRPHIRFYAGVALRDEADHILGALCVIDRTRRRPESAQLEALEELATAVSGALVLHRSVHQLQHLATTDPLTGILNRKGLDIYIASLATTPACFMLFDLDHFKTVNDSFGHAAGDLALREVARRINIVVRDSDALARIGGDEFAIVLADVSSINEGMLVAERVHRLLAEPFMIGGTPVVLAASIGIACRPLHGTNTAQLFEMADAALYAAKAAGRGTSRSALDDGPMVVTARLGRTTLGERLAAATRAPDDAFEIMFQPIFDTITGIATSVEALIRWQVEGIDISPAVFIPLAESLGLAPEIDRFMLRVAGAAASPWPEARRLSVNFSALSLGLPVLEALLLDQIKASGFNQSRLTIELTETALSMMPENLCRTLERLVAGGLSIALDDFGAGQTSLVQLRRLPIRSLKIDRALVHDAALDERGSKILASIADLGAALGIIVIAEGVETEAEFQHVKLLGIPRVQGFYLSPPVNIEDLEQSIMDGTKRVLAASTAKRTLTASSGRPFELSSISEAIVRR